MLSKNISPESLFMGVSDEITARTKVSEILNKRVYNNDVVEILKSGKLSADNNMEDKAIDNSTIKKSDVQLLSEGLENSIHKYAMANINEQCTKELTNDSQDSEDTVRRRLSFNIQEISIDQEIYNQTSILKYRENVFQNSSKMLKGIPPFPGWIYKEVKNTKSQTRKINVGGRIFEIHKETYSNLPQTKLHNCLMRHKQKEMVFIDRDPVCFNSILNFYRTGKLHVPPNVCLTFFEEELIFWGIHEKFIEPCCWSDYQTYKLASNRLKKYSEDSEKNQKFSKPNFSKKFQYRKQIYQSMTTGAKSKVSLGLSMICGAAIIIGILCMIIETTPKGRVNKITRKMAVFLPNDTVSSFLERTKMNRNLANTEILISGYFLFELFSRMFLCPSKLDFFSDSLNWVDIIATITSIVGTSHVIEMKHNNLVTYILFLKVPRIMRLFRLTETLRCGIGAFTLTIRACLQELKLVFLIILMSSFVFGVMMFCVEVANHNANIYSVYIGMWWAITTMGGVGYGDFVPTTYSGYLVGTFCILGGMIICQMPVTIFLTKFSIYYNQANARLISQGNLLLFENVDKTEIRNIESKYVKKYELKLKENKFKRFISKVI